MLLEFERGCNGVSPCQGSLVVPRDLLRGTTRHGLSSYRNAAIGGLNKSRTTGAVIEGKTMPDAQRTADDRTTGGGRERTRSGSSSRKKQHVMSFRLGEEERATLIADAERSGLTVGSYIRERTLAVPRTRSRRQPGIEVAAVTRLQGELNRIGSNIYQITRRINFGDTPTATEIREAFAGYRECIAAILNVLGRGPR
jgi:hypothetical protein